MEKQEMQRNLDDVMAMLTGLQYVLRLVVCGLDPAEAANVRSVILFAQEHVEETFLSSTLSDVQIERIRSVLETVATPSDLPQTLMTYKQKPKD